MQWCSAQACWSSALDDDDQDRFILAWNEFTTEQKNSCGNGGVVSELSRILTVGSSIESSINSLQRTPTDTSGLTIVLVVPWDPSPFAAEGPPTNCQFFTTLFWRLNVEPNVRCRPRRNYDYKKVVNFFGEEKGTPEKILAPRTRKGPPP